MTTRKKKLPEPIDASPEPCEAERLNAAEMAAAMNLTTEQAAMLDRIAAGLPVKRAREAVAALRLKADFGMARPKDRGDANTPIYLISPYPVACTRCGFIEPLAKEDADNE